MFCDALTLPVESVTCPAGHCAVRLRKQLFNHLAWYLPLLSTAMFHRTLNTTQSWFVRCRATTSCSSDETTIVTRPQPFSSLGGVCRRWRTLTWRRKTDTNNDSRQFFKDCIFIRQHLTGCLKTACIRKATDEVNSNHLADFCFSVFCANLGASNDAPIAANYWNEVCHVWRTLFSKCLNFLGVQLRVNNYFSRFS